MKCYDTIIIGGGGIGLATAYQMIKRNAEVLVLEKSTFLNQEGSSAGFSRQYRVPYPEEYMVKLAVDSKPYWDELQLSANKPLLTRAGTLWFGDPNVRSTEGNIPGAKMALKQANVPFRSLTAREVEETYRFLNLPETYVGLFQADGASIDIRECLHTLLRCCREAPGVSLEDESRIKTIKREGDIIKVSTDRQTFHGKKLVLAPGPYINEVLSLLGLKMEVSYWEMTSAYFKKRTPAISYPTWFVFQQAVDENAGQFYGFPAVDWDYPGYVRVAPDFVSKPLVNPLRRTGVPDPQTLSYTSAWVAAHMKDLDPEPRYTSTCLVALSNIENKEMVLDFANAPGFGNSDVVICATGWAAKFIPLLGKILTELALDGKTSYDITPFQSGKKYLARIE